MILSIYVLYSITTTPQTVSTTVAPGGGRGSVPAERYIYSCLSTLRAYKIICNMPCASFEIRIVTQCLNIHVHVFGNPID